MSDVERPVKPETWTAKPQEFSYYSQLNRYIDQVERERSDLEHLAMYWLRCHNDLQAKFVELYEVANTEPTSPFKSWLQGWLIDNELVPS